MCFRSAEIGNPPGPITKLKFTGEGVLVGALGIICFLSTGLGGRPPLTPESSHFGDQELWSSGL